MSLRDENDLDISTNRARTRSRRLLALEYSKGWQSGGKTISRPFTWSWLPCPAHRSTEGRIHGDNGDIAIDTRKRTASCAQVCGVFISRRTAPARSIDWLHVIMAYHVSASRCRRLQSQLEWLAPHCSAGNRVLNLESVRGKKRL